MKLHFFAIPTLDPAAEADRLNRLLASERVVCSSVPSDPTRLSAWCRA